MVKLRLGVNDEEYDDLVAYNDVINYIEQDHQDEGVWKYKEILDHEGPFNPSHSKYNGSKYNLLIEWEGGERTWEPLKIIAMDDPVAVAIYGKDNDLLKLDGWKHLKRLAERQKKMVRIVRQAKLRSH